MPLNNPADTSLYVTDYIELVGNEAFKPTGSAGSWVVWDISAIIPAGAKWADIYAKQSTAGYPQCGVRATGSALARLISHYNQIAAGVLFIVKLNVARTIEIYAQSATQAENHEHNVLGYRE